MKTGIIRVTIPMTPAFAGIKMSNRINIPDIFKGMKISMQPSVYKSSLVDALKRIARDEGWLYTATKLPHGDAYTIKQVPKENLLKMKEVHFINGPISGIAFRDKSGKPINFSKAQLTEASNYSHAQLTSWFRGINPNNIALAGHRYGELDHRREYPVTQ